MREGYGLAISTDDNGVKAEGEYSCVNEMLFVVADCV